MYGRRGLIGAVQYFNVHFVFLGELVIQLGLIIRAMGGREGSMLGGGGGGGAWVTPLCASLLIFKFHRCEL